MIPNFLVIWLSSDIDSSSARFFHEFRFMVKLKSDVDESSSINDSHDEKFIKM